MQALRAHFAFLGPSATCPHLSHHCAHPTFAGIQHSASLDSGHCPSPAASFSRLPAFANRLQQRLLPPHLPLSLPLSIIASFPLTTHYHLYSKVFFHATSLCASMEGCALRKPPPATAYWRRLAAFLYHQACLGGAARRGPSGRMCRGPCATRRIVVLSCCERYWRARVTKQTRWALPSFSNMTVLRLAGFWGRHAHGLGSMPLDINHS